MQPQTPTPKNAATFRIKKARKIEVTLKKSILKKLTTLQARVQKTGA